MPTPIDSSVIITINPGSTSTKVAIFKGTQLQRQEKLAHEVERLKSFKKLWDQFDFRLQAIENFLNQQNFSETSVAGVVGRGGLFKPVRRGTYKVNETMLADARQGVQGTHISNMGCALAQKIADKYGCDAYVVDPVSVDEFEDIARISGHPAIQRRSLSHALNLRAATWWAAEQWNIDPVAHNFIVAHMGGGISIAAIQNDRIVDVNDASSDGPFSPERTGGLPLMQFIDLIFSRHYPQEKIKRLVMGEGGLAAYLGTNDVQKVSEMVQRDESLAKLIFSAMAYQIAKEIGCMSTVLCGDVRGIVLTGGLANSQALMERVIARVQFIAPVLVLPGELEMEAMAHGLYRVLNNRENLKEY
jgi:butyrate kinase